MNIVLTATHPRCSHSSGHSHRSLSLNSVDMLISNSLPNVLNISCKTHVFSCESDSRTTLNGLYQLMKMPKKKKAAEQLAFTFQMNRGPVNRNVERRCFFQERRSVQVVAPQTGEPNHPTTRKSPATAWVKRSSPACRAGSGRGLRERCRGGFWHAAGDCVEQCVRMRGSSRDEWMSAGAVLTSPAAEHY